jgi:hypothetical protein
MREGKWIRLKVCVACEHELSWNDIFLSDGFCRRCGRLSPGKVCETVNVVYQEINIGTWYWPVTRYKPKDEISLLWLQRGRYPLIGTDNKPIPYKNMYTQ